MTSSQTAQSVLVVEDDADLRGVIEWFLETEGYRVRTAENGLLALQLVQQEAERPSVILLDMRMPVMDGWQFADHYRALPGPKVPIVVMTAARDAAGWAHEIQAEAYLAKPFELEDLLSAVEHPLGV